MSLIPVQISDLNIGHPLSWNLYNQENKQLFQRGYVIQTTAELEKLGAMPLFRSPEAQSEPTEAVVKKPPFFKFNDMQLRVGSSLQFNLTSNKTSHTVALIGYVKDVTLMVMSPWAAQQTGSHLIEGDQVLVRLFSGQSAFSFTVFVKTIIKIPFPYLHLSFPGHILGQAIRKSQRIKTDINATVSNNQNSAIISDLSTTGARIVTDSSLGEPGTKIELSFTAEIYGKETPILLQCVIKSLNISKENDQDKLYFGVEFIDLQSDQDFTLQNLIYQEIVEHPTYII